MRASAPATPASSSATADASNLTPCTHQLIFRSTAGTSWGMVDRFRAITHVLRQEASVSLGLTGRKLRFALEALRRFDAGGKDRSPDRRRELVQNAAYILSAYVIQREALGLRTDEETIAEFGITPEIWNSIGAAKVSRDRSL